MPSLISTIPSPSSGVLHIGPLTVHAYGVCIALGVLAAVWLFGRRWAARGHDPEIATTLAMWGVPAGIVGARAYHVITDFELYRHDLAKVLVVWDGGLGIWGGIAAGVTAGLVVGRRRGLPLRPLMDAVAPGLALAQAIGRWGNYFNQELFGRPTSLPWGLRIDYSHRPDAFRSVSSFHPTFLYESLWDLAICGVLLLVDQRRRLRPGQLFCVYVALYTFGRFFVERLRSDFAHTILGLRVNEWTSVAVFCAAVVALLALARKDAGASPDGGAAS